ncbi:acetoacetate decarboxylase family protein [Haloarcula hispanica]|uniref:Acetoacetate decarboxylase n=1 Tax=Haloarcula hispanica TaxID=51589 RepID=A0A482THY4_HALHI|nr:acetoacetate decarboxylase family protein [Haloarcula hispanica]MCJ0620456.1 acetoacetate decarboxylase family protein [Haloarcula hispanica]RYJ11639.1 acetoacetate decarboxylase [Haloarcula hispanica]
MTRLGDGDRVRLSTGHEVTLPLVTEATVAGAVLPARYDVAESLLPDGLAPVRATARRAAVVLLCVEYHRIGDDAMAPYDEFAVLISATADGRRPPLLPLLTRNVGGYVWSLPVTTEPACALGDEIWGYPKTVADITHRDDATRRETTVVEDGNRVATVGIDWPRTWERRETVESYAVREGQLERTPIEFQGKLGAAPLSNRVDVDLGDHERADTLRSLDLGSRSVLRFSLEGRITYGAGRPVER